MSKKYSEAIYDDTAMGERPRGAEGEKIAMNYAEDLYDEIAELKMEVRRLKAANKALRATVKEWRQFHV